MSPDSNPSIADELRHRLRVLVITTFVLGAVIIGIGVAVYLNASNVGHDANRTHDALCTLRGDLQHRVETTQTFLREHPEGFAGIPAATLRQSMQGQQRTIAALGSLDCER